MERLLLVGTTHVETDAKDTALERLITEIKPDILTIECPKNYEEVKSKLRKVFEKKGLEPKYIAKLVPSNYELRICKEYALKNNIPLHYVEEALDINSRIEELEKTPIEVYKKAADAEQSLRFINAGMGFLGCDFASLVQRSLDGKENPELDKLMRGYRRGGFIGKRDSKMAAELKEIYDKNPDKTIVHVGGAAHCVPDDDTLVGLLHKDIDLSIYIVNTNRAMYSYKKE